MFGHDEDSFADSIVFSEIIYSITFMFVGFFFTKI